MLGRLTIENYALIHRLEIEFSPGFSVITGETGAGKSIILGALALILGQRADSNVLMDKAHKCIIEGVFMIKDYALETFFNTNDLDYEETVILRREINAQGKSRAFINDTPVTLSLLKNLGDQLVNVHSQNSITTLNDSNFQLAVLDNYTGQFEKVIDFRHGFQRLMLKKNELEALIHLNSKTREERDYLNFLFNEFNQARLQSGEQEELEQRLKILTHAEEIKTRLFQSTEIISRGEENILLRLAEVIHNVSAIAKFREDIDELQGRLQSNLIDIKDIAGNIEKIGEHISFDASEIEIITLRLDQIYQLQKKHHVNSIDELLLIRQSIENKLLEGDSLDEKINQFQTLIHGSEESLKADASILSKARNKAIYNFEKEIVAISAMLGMNNASFKIECIPLPLLTRDGLDKIRFLFSANKGIVPDDITKIASGGELSRLMLGIKSMVSRKNLLPTIIFDEIDNGVSGEIAGKIGSILKKMAQNMQVIVITHLPQIAGKGDWQYKVYKTEEQGHTRSYIKHLSSTERVEEIAKMLSDERVSASAFQTAKELLES